jgi:uncharacterized membrane protein
MAARCRSHQLSHQANPPSQGFATAWIVTFLIVLVVMGITVARRSWLVILVGGILTLALALTMRKYVPHAGHNREDSSEEDRRGASVSIHASRIDGWMVEAAP